MSAGKEGDAADISDYYTCLEYKTSRAYLNKFDRYIASNWKEKGWHAETEMYNDCNFLCIKTRPISWSAPNLALLYLVFFPLNNGLLKQTNKYQQKEKQNKLKGLKLCHAVKRIDALTGLEQNSMKRTPIFTSVFMWYQSAREAVGCSWLLDFWFSLFLSYFIATLSFTKTQRFETGKFSYCTFSLKAN